MRFKDPTEGSTPMDPTSHLLLLVSLKLNFATKINITMCVLLLWKRKQWAILSRETSEELAILKLEINAMKEETRLRDFPECFKGVGKVKGFQARLHIDESV